MTQEDSQFLNVHKAASFLGVHPNTIRRWAQENKLSGKRIGTRGDWRFTREALQQLMRDNHTPGELSQEPVTPAARGEKPGASADFLAGGGEMGERIRAKDWSVTPLGSVAQWPQSLKTIVRIMLTSRQPIWIGWGPELIKLYNDPYKTIVGGKHPEALGQPAAVVWHEIWDAIGPRLQTVMQSNEGTYDESLLLMMERYGYQEETYYTFSYSPVPADQGGVGGIICANTDDTQRIIGERQVKLLRTLAAETSGVRTLDEVCCLSVQSLEHNPYDIPFALLYLFDQEKQEVSLVGTTGIQRGQKAAPENANLDAETIWPFREAIQSEKIGTISDLSSRFEHLPTGAWKQAPSQAVTLHISPSGQTGKAGVLIVGLNPFRLFDEGYQGFLKLVAGQIAANIASAQAYEEEHKRIEALAEIDRAKTVFFSNVSHEFRTPLTLLLGPIEDARLDPTTISANQERMEIAHRNALRLLKLVNSLLDFSRIEAGRMQLWYEPTDLSTYTSELASNFQSAIEQAGMHQISTIAPISEPIYIDRNMWEKIVLNLLSNAFKFTFEGEIELSLREQQHEVVLQVRDTGVGIPPEHLPHIFERFHRVEGGKSRSYEGSGIGLSLVQELVKLHKGTLEVESVEDQGTTFTVTLFKGTDHLPQDRIGIEQTSRSSALGSASYVEEAIHWLPEESESTTHPSDEKVESIESSEGFVERPRVVLADDNADMRIYIKRLLAHQFDVEAVSNGAQALQAVKNNPPDLLISDVMMPEMSGLQLLQAVKEHPDTARVPVILLSARAGEEAIVEGVKTGADNYLVKPFSAQELLARVTTHIKMARIRYDAERRLYDLFMQVPAAVLILRGSNYRVELANSATLDIWGRKSEDVLGKPLFDVLPEVRGQGLEQLLEGVLATGTPYIGSELKIRLDRNRDGTLVDVYFTFVYAPLRDAANVIEGIMVFAYEVTEQILARRQIEESEVRFRTLADNIPNLVWMARPDGSTYWYNSRWYTYTGATPAQMEVRGWQNMINQEVLPMVQERWQQALSSGEPFEMTYFLQGADQVMRPFLTRIVPIYDAQGVIVQWFGTSTDITEQKKLEQQKDDFLGIASHELKTPVTSLKGYAQLLERRFRAAGDERSAVLAQKMDIQLNKLTSLIGDLLDVTKIESGKLSMRFSSFDFNELVQEIVEETQRTTSRHVISLELSESVIFCGDRDRIGQVLTNLLINAIKYSPQSEHVFVKTFQEEDSILTSVQDFGIGIPAEKQQNIFERFFRVEEGAQSTFSGLGLGLYISAEIVHRHYGSLWVKSEEGKGTTMFLSFPLKRISASLEDEK